MAPWSLWPQSTSQQPQQEQNPQEPPPSPPSPALPPKVTSPPSTQTSTTPSTGYLGVKPNDAYNKELSSTEILQIATKSLQTGMIAGSAGLVFGAGSGILRSAPPTLFALFAGLQWFTLGSTYMVTKGLLCNAYGGEENMSPFDMIKVSGASGGASGVMGGLIRGPKNILPGCLVFGTIGVAGSYMSQLVQGREVKPSTSWLDSKWSPMQRLSDKDYMSKIEEKILRLDAEIAIVDENIASLRESSKSSVTSTESTTK